MAGARKGAVAVVAGLGNAIAVTRTAASQSQRCLIKMCKVSVVDEAGAAAHTQTHTHTVAAPAAAAVPLPANPSFPLPCVFSRRKKKRQTN